MQKSTQATHSNAVNIFGYARLDFAKSSLTDGVGVYHTPVAVGAKGHIYSGVTFAKRFIDRVVTVLRVIQQ